MVMRVGGIFSGMDIEAMVEKLMEAERMPLNRLKQQQTKLEWKRDAFREINSKLLELDNLMLDMKLSRTYNPKTATSSNESAVTATASSSTTNGSYNIRVDQLAKSAMNFGEALDSNIADIDLSDYVGEHTFHTFDENGTRQDHTFEVREGDTLQQVLTRINNDRSNNIRLFIDESNVEGPRVVMETTRTGVYNTQNSDGGQEVIFNLGENENKFFTEVLKLDQSRETGAQNAKFTYNDNLEIDSRTNTYTLNGITFELNDVTESNVRITVSTDVDQSVETIKNFVEKYNEMIDLMNKSQTEERHRNYEPLLEEQKEEMTDKQIELWEERAKSGILRGESVIRDGMYALRSSLQGKVDTDSGEYTLLSEIGITTTANYLDGGKLQIDEEKLRAALRDNPEDVYKLFTSNSEDGKGIIHRFDEALDRTRANIERQAGKSHHTLDNYTLGKRMKELNKRISDFEQRMIRVEQRYWNQFTAMEKAIANLSQQSDYLFSQFGGGM